MKEFFLEIWSENEHKSEISGDRLHNLSHPQWHWQFSHILPKGLYPKFKHNKANICLMTPEEHQLWGFHSYKIKDDPQWKWLFEKRDALKQEYHSGKT